MAFMDNQFILLEMLISFTYLLRRIHKCEKVLLLQGYYLPPILKFLGQYGHPYNSEGWDLNSVFNAM